MLLEQTYPSLRPRGFNVVWESVLQLATRSVFPAGFPLSLTGEALFDFYYIEKGSLLISYAAQSGKERPILSLMQGTIFNTSSALAGFDNPDSSYICQEETILWRFPGSLLHSPDFVRKYPELIINLMISLGSKNLKMHETLSYTGADAALVQLSRWLLRTAEIHQSLEFRPGHTQQELAEMLGIHRATLVRCLGELRRQGAVSKFTKNLVCITDVKKLKDIVM